MSDKMLIDASHPEETRVAVLRDGRLEEFDFEAADRKPLRGNVYLAKVVRVEPSLQAAFVEYGGNRHGFLAFSEIHPDWYQIPLADRQAIMEEEERAAREEEAEDERRAARSAAARAGTGEMIHARSAEGDEDDAADENDEDGPGQDETGEDDGAPAPSADEPDPSASRDDEDAPSGEAADEPAEAAGEGAGAEAEAVEELGGESEDEAPRSRRAPRRSYQIQEVVKRRQILLVQVVKEERGSKGAALTTYLSLAGRYCVLMPNSPRGGGISRKIASAGDRRRLKEVVSGLDVPQGMGVILRTAGASRSQTEISQDFESLLRVWEEVRELTLRSFAPALVHEEGSLIRRNLRDLYGKGVNEIVVEGDAAYRDAKAFMASMSPEAGRAVQPYREREALFARYGVEKQLDGLFSSTVNLRSGGYLVINQTEALVAIDVNSGRSTREHNIESTALKTNLEAADEVARQLRLRDLAGLIVIDFIDMDEGRHDKAVEKRLKEALKNDRARIQIGRISSFGLLEMSRQRMRTGVVEGSSIPCPHCGGSGQVRSGASVALHLLRQVEELLVKSASHDLIVRTRTEVALYVLNQKRDHLRRIEERFGVHVRIEVDDNRVGANLIGIERGEAASGVPVTAALAPSTAELAEKDEALAPAVAVATGEPSSEASPEAADGAAAADTEGRRRRRRRRRRRGGEGSQAGDAQGEAGGEDEDDGSEDGDHEIEDENAAQESAVSAEAPAEEVHVSIEVSGAEPVADAPVAAMIDAPEPTPGEDAEVAPKPRARRPRRTKAAIAAEAAEAEALAAEAESSDPAPAEAGVTTEASTRDEPVPANDPLPRVAAEREPRGVDPSELGAEQPRITEPELASTYDPARAKRKGWWARKLLTR